MRGRKLTVWIVALVLIVGITAALTGCAKKADTGTTGTTTTKPIKIAPLLPETKTARYETQDKPLFEAKVKELAPDAEILYSNANQDATEQQSQADAALTNGAQVLVLDPVDSASAASIVSKAKAQNVPVISYDRLVMNADLDYYISFDNEKVGTLQGQALLDKITADGNAGKTIIMINGSPTDNNATLFKKGAHSVLDGKVKIGVEYDTPDWSPDKAQTEMDQAITKLGKDGFVAVYCANDGTCGGAIAAMKGAGIDPKTKPSTGQDAELAGIQRILLGEQYMTIYKAIKLEAEAAAELAVALAKGEPVPSTMTLSKVNNTTKDVDSILLAPVAVTKDNIKDTVVADGFWTAEQIMSTPELQTAGKAAGCSDGNPLTMSDTDASPYLLSLKGVCKAFGANQALTDVDFEVAAGEVVALVGDNGAGKSTLIKAIAGVQLADEGTFYFNGEPVKISSPQGATALGIATVYQDLALCDNLDVVANLYLGREVFSGGAARAAYIIDETTMEQNALKLLESLAVTTIQDVREPVGSLSGGQRQSVATARSLLGEPSVVLLDEPTAALGVSQTEQVLNLIRRLADRGLGVVVISHNLKNVFTVADRIIVLRLGRRAAAFDVRGVTREDVVAAITGAEFGAEDDIPKETA